MVLARAESYDLRMALAERLGFGYAGNPETSIIVFEPKHWQDEDYLPGGDE